MHSTSWPERLRRYARPLGLGLGVVALLLVARQAWLRRSELAPLLRRLDVTDAATATCVCLLALLLLGLTWHVLSRGRIDRSRLFDDMSRWGASILTKYLPGKLWQGVARGALYQGETSAGSVFVLFLREQALSFSAAAMIAMIWVPAADASELTPWLRPAFLLMMLGLLLVAVVPDLPGFIRARLPERWSVWNGTRPAGRTIVAGWCLSLAAHLSMAYGIALLSGALGLPAIPFPQIATAVCASGLIGAVVLLAPAGLGVRDAVLFFYLSSVLETGQAAMLALAARCMTTVAEVLVFFLAIGLLALKRR